MINKRIYINIQEKNVTLPNVKDAYICYSVTFITELNYLICGHIVKTKKISDEVPFLFKSVEIAKDFCELNPLYKQKTVINTKFIDHVYYHTYELYNNAKEIIGQLYFNKDFVTVVRKQNGDVHFNGDVISTPLVEKFVHRIYVPDLGELQKYTNLKDAIGWSWCGCNKLSDLIHSTKPIVSNTENLYTYEMVQKEEY